MSLPLLRECEVQFWAEKLKSIYIPALQNLTHFQQDFFLLIIITFTLLKKVKITFALYYNKTFAFYRSDLAMKSVQNKPWQTFSKI